jgi:hypothetical protein
MKSFCGGSRGAVFSKKAPLAAGGKMELEPLPISHAELERYRISSRYQKRPGLVGGHRMRRKGQSLEFYDYRPYVPGDDVRYVDWRASARHGNAEDLLVRTFVAEEQLTLVISLDTRDTMKMPALMPKILIASWLVEAISWIALRSDDRVILHRLFGRAAGSIQELYGSRSSPIRKVLSRFLSYRGPKDPVNINILERYLNPAVVWLIISDFYFDMETEGQKLGRRAAEAQDGMRWVIQVDTDSWPYEKYYLGQGPRKVEGPGLLTADRPLEIDTNTIVRVENSIKEHKQRFRDNVSRGAFDYICWKWPAQEQPDARFFFEDHFGKDRVLQRLFMKESQ